MRRLDDAIAKGLNHAFETTLGGKSVTARILQATKTHAVLIWFCGLSSPELHIARVEARVVAAEAAADGTVPDPTLTGVD
jgi:predicted ABC-type ATPase